MKKKKSTHSAEKDEKNVKTTSQEEQKQIDEIAEKECCREKIEQLNDKFLRLLAEFENFKKRTLKEKEDFYKTASSKVIISILPVIDDLDRAFVSIPETEETKPILDGFGLIIKKFRSILQQMGLEPIECLDEEFNTDFHEALTTIDAGEDKKGKVIEEVEKGYMLNGHVIRFAKVVVGK